jgi:aminoglycoside 6'-N-acetyltransferase
MKILPHNVILRGEKVTLRPMTEADWDILLKWNSDPEVLYYSEGDDVQSYNLEEIQGIYRGTSQTAFCFIVEIKGVPVGESWLQQMNYPRILQKYPGRDCRRIDLMIGEKTLWGKGLGSEIIGLLVGFAFEQEKADLVFGCEIADYNPRSLRAFQKVGFEVVETIQHPSGSKARIGYDVRLSREEYLARIARI